MGERASLRQVWHHRRRIKTEEKANVVAAVWGEEFFQFLAALVILARTILKNRMNSSFSFKSSGCNSSYNSNCPAQNSWCGKVLNKFFPPNKGDGRCLFFRLYPFFCVWDTVVVFSFSTFAFIIKRVTKKGVN